MIFGRNSRNNTTNAPAWRATGTSVETRADADEELLLVDVPAPALFVSKLDW